MAQTDETPTLTSIVSESFPHLRRGAIRDFLNIMQAQKYFKESAWNKSESTYTFETGSKIEFFSADQGDKLRGARRDRLFINEANNVTLEAFNELEVRTKEFILIDFNPTVEFWAFTDVCGCGMEGCSGTRTDTEHIILTYLDNEALDEAIVNTIEQRRLNKAWFRVYGMGLLGEVETRIYKGWQIIDEVPFEARLERYAIDFGYTNDPTAIVAIYYHNGGYIIDELTYQTSMLNKQIADVIKFQPKKALTIADSAEPKSIDEIRLEGITILPAQKGRDSVLQGIQHVQAQQISVTKNSTNVIKEYRNYVWITDKDGKIINEPDHLWSHSMDAIRYGLTSIKNPNQNHAHVHIPSSSMPRNNLSPVGQPVRTLPPELQDKPRFAHTHIPRL